MYGSCAPKEKWHRKEQVIMMMMMMMMMLMIMMMIKSHTQNCARCRVTTRSTIIMARYVSREMGKMKLDLPGEQKLEKDNSSTWTAYKFIF